MKRALIVAVIAGAIALFATLAYPAPGEEPVPVPADIVATTTCPSGDGLLVAAGGGWRSA